MMMMMMMIRILPVASPPREGLRLDVRLVSLFVMCVSLPPYERASLRRQTSLSVTTCHSTVWLQRLYRENSLTGVESYNRKDPTIINIIVVVVVVCLVKNRCTVAIGILWPSTTSEVIPGVLVPWDSTEH
jgi:hypothetical protein